MLTSGRDDNPRDGTMRKGGRCVLPPRGLDVFCRPGDATTVGRPGDATMVGRP